MTKDNKISMPSGIGGLVRYFDEYKSKLEFRPGIVIIVGFIIVIAMVILHSSGTP